MKQSSILYKQLLQRYKAVESAYRLRAMKTSQGTKARIFLVGKKQQDTKTLFKLRCNCLTWVALFVKSGFCRFLKILFILFFLSRIQFIISSSNLSWSTTSIESYEIFLWMIWEVCYFLIITSSSLVAHFITFFFVTTGENQWHRQQKSWCFFLISTRYELLPKMVMMYKTKERFGALLASYLLLQSNSSLFVSLFFRRFVIFFLHLWF